MKKVFVGQKATRKKTISAKDIRLFTEMTGDAQALHYDTGLAVRLGYKAPLAQGGVITGILNAIVAHDLPGEGSVFLNCNWNFKHAVCIGDTITGAVEITSVREDKPIMHLKTTVTNQDGIVCVDGTAVVYVREV